MTTSLKSFLPVLSRILAEPADALYKRQLALVREGLMESVPGQGRGSGVRATPESVAMLLIGVLASPSLSQAGPAARWIANARPGYPKYQCPLTGATTFGGVLAKVLSDESISKRVVNVSVQPSAKLASVTYDDDHAISLSFDKQHESKIKVRFSTSLAAETIHELTKAVTKLLSNEKPHIGQRSFWDNGSAG
ncbi:MAG: hypothetical protein WBY67_05235 [Pseudolabrys sp.]